MDASVDHASTKFRGVTAKAFVRMPEDFRALLQDAVVIAAPWRKRLRVTGADAQRWLNGMVTNNTAALAIGEGCYAFLLNAQGRIQGDVTAFRTADSGGHAAYLLETDAAQLDTVREWLDRYIIMDDVAITDVLGSAAAVAGPDAAASMRKMELQIPEHPLRLHEGNSSDGSVSAWFDPAYCRPVYWLWFGDGEADRLPRVLAQSGAEEAGWQALEWLRIASGIPQFGQDILARDLPQETAQSRALHFRKGCYLGQEIVERIHSRGNVHRGLQGFLLSEAPTALPMPITDEATEIGSLTSAATLPLPGGVRHVGMGIARTAAVLVKKPLQAGGVQLEPLPFPFI